MAGKSASISVKILGDESPLRRSFQRAGKDVDSFAKRMDNVGRRMSSIGSTLTQRVTLPIVAAAGASFKMAADLADAMGATEQIFGKAADDVKAWAQKLPSYYGIARGEAHEYANMMGALLQNIGGMSEEQAAMTSAALVQLAGDLTAMFGGTTQDAIRALTGALKGNTAMLDNYGISAMDAQQKQKALEMGIWDGTGALTQQQKQAAILALIWEQTSAAQGQAKREADGASGQLRSLTTDAKNLATEIGTMLLPIGVQLLGMVRDWIDRFTSLDERTQKIILVIAGIAAAVGPVLIVVGKFITAIAAIMKVIAPLKAAFAAAGGGLAGIKAAMLAIMGPVGWIIAGIVALGVALFAAYKKWEGFRNVVDAVGRFLRDIFMKALDGIRNWWATNGPTIIAAAQAAWEAIKSGAQTVWQVISTVFQAVAGFFTGTVFPIFQTVWNVARTIFGAIASFISGVVFPVFQTLASIVTTVFQAVAAVISWAWSSIVSPILNAWWSFIQGPVLFVLKLLLAIGLAVFAAISAAISAFWNKVGKPVFNAVRAVITGIVIPAIQRIIAVAAPIFARLASVISTMWRTASGIFRTFASTVGSLVGTVSRAVGQVISWFGRVAGGIGRALAGVGRAIKAPFETAFNGVKRLWNNTIGRISFTVPSWVPGLGGKGWSFPKMHSGGLVPGRPGSEYPAVLEAGESVRTRRQERELQAILGQALALATARPAGESSVHVHFHGPVAQDSVRWIADQVEEAVRRGYQMPRLKQVRSA